ncbi:MAG: periplasmic heavy metal sensor [Burkholderiales bacterium]
MKTRNTLTLALVTSALFALGAQGALAQPAGPGAGFGGPGAHGMGGPGGPGGHGGMSIEGALASVKSQLNLNTSQQVMWDNAAAATKAARDAGRAAMQQVQATMNAELAKAEPDLAAVAAAGDAAHANAQTLRKQVRDQWLALYATFTPAQKAVVRDALKARADRMETFRARMQERMSNRPAAN